MKAFIQLLRSMRFAIAILTVVAIASAIGSVLEQGQPTAVYVGRYGEFWATLFAMTGLTDVYHASWFLGLLGFMAVSTALCLAQHTPSMLREMRSFREQKSLQSLMQLPCSAELDAVRPDSTLRARAGAYLRTRNFRFVTRELQNGGYVLAARAGGMRRMGYLLVHAAIVLICVGGLIDGNIGLRLGMMRGEIVPETRDLPPAEVPPQSRLDEGGSFRAVLNLNEGGTGNAAFLPMKDGYLLQELPFSVRLKRFQVEHYSNGQAKDFVSDIEIIDGDTRREARLQVNHPFTYKGITFYQSGFGDGGTSLALELVPLDGEAAPAAIAGRVGGDAPVLLGGEAYRIEFTDFRAVNVFSGEQDKGGTWFVPAAQGDMHDVGASLSFRLRDALGQASEWEVFMRPLDVQGARYFVIGKRDAQQSSMRYVRLPADGDGKLAAYRRFSAAMQRPEAREHAARTVAARVQNRELAGAIERSTVLLLDSFAEKGFRAVAEMVEAGVPGAEQDKAAPLYVDLLQRAAAILHDESAGDASSRFVRDSLIAYSDAAESGIGLYLDLTGYKQVHSSALQVTRAPGAAIVYLGMAMLALGTCAMYFVRERRLWIWVLPSVGKVFVGLAANRPLPGLQAEFIEHRAALLNLIHSRS
ncbi:cytochrome c biogenesis protein ResB [Noviherbaspirillum sp.]|uniref:cytochrome c biogenesis protein ResB n=1 Tax=Noviherbaspirillum sp. TaxID=1926288 RepID=UPI002D764528|nr:cytochrome c biogenesis protein ResB [Noviherbaspirillum sp.]HZW20742.1 cytochrome c biogenesis protein ResB [Noviherbaspirillum sp.]